MADIPNADVCYLDKMPPEVRQKIFGFAIIFEKDVAPFQVKKRSNKFFWDKAQKDPKKASDVPQLTAVHLSRCSKKIYDEVATTHLFYQVNHFDFTNVSQFVKFIAAITPNRAKAIQSISTTYVNQGSYGRNAMHDFHPAALRACHGLQHLEFVFLASDSAEYFHTKLITMENANPDLLVAVQGLKSFKVTVAAYNPTTHFNEDVYDLGITNTKKSRESLESFIRQAMLVDKSKTYRLSKNFPQLTDWARLDIHGEGRLGEDRKPGVVASRTRQSTKNLSKLDAFGVIPKENPSKYNIVGDLSWDIDTMTGARASDDILYPVEFQCTLRYRDAEDLRWVIPQPSTTWESLGVLNSGAHRRAIVSFYSVKLSAYGKELVRDVWKTGGAQHVEGYRRGDTYYERIEKDEQRRKANAIKDLEKLIVLEAAVKAAEEAEKLKEAKKKSKKAKAKEAKAAKAAKVAKKAVQGKGNGRRRKNA